MKISVVIPTYNEEKVIAECLQSLLKQSYKDLEIIVVDDGSKDNSKFKVQNAIRQLADKIQNLKFFEQEHKGAGAARNLGAKHAAGDILVFVDADMTFAPDFIEKLVAPIVGGKAIGTFSKEEYVANKNNIWARCWNINRGLPQDRMHRADYPETQKVFRAVLKSEFGKVGGFDEKAGYIDDWSLAEKLGVEAVAAPRAIFYHKNPDSLSDVFIQSKWMAKRKYKHGLIGLMAVLLRTSLPVSVVFGILLATYYVLPHFFIFKVISDFGQFTGLVEYVLFRRVLK